MSKIIIFIGFLLVSQLCIAQQNKCFINADNTEFKHYIDSCSNELIIDVRLADRFITGAIDMAINAPTKLSLLNLLNSIDTDTPILVYCTHGERSVQACNIICEKGFLLVVNLKNGYADW